MTDPTLHRKKPTYSASNAVAALAKAISEIKHQDALTWADIGAVAA